MFDALVKRLPVVFSLLIAVLMVFIVAAAPASAAPARSASSTAGTWAYGAERVVTVGPARAADGWMYEGTLTVGYTVTVYDNNTSATTFELTVDRTIGAALTLQFCLPGCGNATNWVNLSYRAYQATEGFSNFTSQGTVQENGQSVPAIAIVNSAVHLAENLTESSVEHLPILGWIGNHDRYLSGEIVGDAGIVFTPSLGLIPLTLAQGSAWNSTSSFSLAGGANYSYYYAGHFPVRTVIVGPVSGPITFARTGNVSVSGAYSPGSTVDLGGVTYPAISLSVTGPFTVLEGVVLLPNAADVFGSATSPVSTNASATTNLGLSAVDGSFVGHNFHVTASSWHYATSSANPYDAASASQLEGSGLAPAASTPTPISAATVQGEPETPAQTGQVNQCLVSNIGCTSSTGGGPVSHGLFALVVLGGTVATVGALIALAVVVSRRRKIPPPTYPNAVLYPPGATAPARPTRAPGSPEPPATPEEDPLDHLW